MQPAIFISHGVPDSIIRETLLKQFLEKLSIRLKNKKPDCVIVFSSKWTDNCITISGNYKNNIIHDKHFDKLHTIRYLTSKSDKYVKEIEAIFKKLNLKYAVNHEHGFDYGVTNPMSKIFPANDVPVIQISLAKNLIPAYHFALGKSLRSLAAKNILVIGSGNMTENLKFSQTIIKELGVNAELPYTDDFLTWMNEKIENNELDELFEYEKLAPHALENHPKPNNILPLFVVLGMSYPHGVKRIHYSQDFAMAVDCYLSKSVIK